MEQTTNVHELKGAPKSDDDYTPVYELRPLSGQETLKVYRILKDAIGNDAIKDALVQGGMDGAQGQVIEVLLDRLDYDVMPLMVAQISGNENMFRDIPNLAAADLESHLTVVERETDADNKKLWAQPSVKELHRRETWKRVNGWMENQPASAPLDLFNDFCAHDSFLAVFESASRSVRLVKKVSLLLGIDLEKVGKSGGSRTPSSSNGPSAASGDDSSASES